MSFTFTPLAAFRRLSTAILVVLTACSAAFAQITVTNATFPTAGTTLRTAKATNPGIAASVLTPPGGNQVWDLSGLQQGQVKTTVFKAASEGSQAANVPGAELVSTSSSSPVAEEYYNVTSTSFQTQASYNYFYDVVPLYLAQPTTPLTERQAPMNFFDLWQSSSALVAANTCDASVPNFVECFFSPSDFPPTLMAQLSVATNGVAIEKLRYRVSINRLEVVDAWGTMIIPGGSFPVLRTKRTEYKEVRLDAKILPLGWLDITDNAIQAGFQGMGVCTTYVYHFINDVEKEPIAIVSSGCAANNDIAANSVEYKLVAPLLSINNVTLSEGNSGTTNFNFTVSLSAPAPAGGVSFDIATQDGTTNPATQPSDYTARSLTSQTIPAGSSTYNFTVAVNGDVDVEPDEIFFVNVSNVTGAILADGQGLGTITNDDVAPVLTSVTVTSSPVGRSISVDGTTYTSPQTFNWTPGSNHTIATTTPQGAAGTRYLFSNWSDGGAISHVVTTPSVATTYTANFTTQYLLTTAASPANGGSFNKTPSSADSYYDAGTDVSITAVPNSGYNFVGFSGDLTGNTNPQSLTMNGPRSVTAQFAAIPPPAASLILTASGPSGTICGENLSVTIKVKDFKDIGTLDFSVNWDPAKLELLSYTPLTIDDDAPLNGEFFPAGQMTYTWADGDIDYGVTLADGTTILTLNFKTLVNSATGVTVNITGTPTAISASDLNFEEVTVTPENQVSFNIERVFVTSPTVTQPTCALSTGTIVVNATGNGTLEYSVDGGTSWSLTNTFADLAPGNYTVAARLQSNPTCIISYSSNPVVLTAATGCCVPPTINAPTVTQPTCATTTGTIVVNATGSGTMEYSINGGTSWSPTATFGGLAPGNYNIAVRLQSSPACLANYSSNPVVLTAATGCVVVCPKSQGYWKNNPSVWPASALPMMLGTSNTYTKQQLRKILNTAVGAGSKADASLILAHQLIAAKLNIAAGATAPASVTSAITAADAAIGTSLIPMKVRPNTTLGKTMTSLAKTLESFNTGQLNAGCGESLTTATMSNGLSMNVVPEGFELEQNYPNPFSSVTTIRYVVPVESTVSLAVYNNQGQLMAKLADGRMRAGNYQVRFDASKLAAGIYLYRLQTVDANGQIVMINKKMILSK